ncbi:PREDICTED: phospholipase A1-Igamma1, chloroplastic [Tarenaya hassleriana]|uniref:phospholipase A1-Igamma1, chloroplastic n=1 Tax=Tarenaya hassleriana TaxID=28532 RepID=UPI00053C89E8|nr:PREDICTED: phospholipase A1-Igamma1, chloroplastic [Tarenaya hassleriana]
MELSPMRKLPAKKLTRRRTKRVWRLKLKLTWNAVKRSLLSTIPKNRVGFHLPGCVSTKKQLSLVNPSNDQELALVAQKINDSDKNSSGPTKTLAFLLQLPKYSALDFIDRGDLMTPAASPRENISKMWREIHGSNNWENLLDPLHPWLRREIIKYGEFVEAVYDSLDFDPLSEFCGSCRYNRNKLFEELGLARHGYKVTKYIYAMSHVDVPQWFLRSALGETWSKDSNWMGLVGVSCDRESRRIGRRDIVVAWRGTVTPTEWFLDLKTKKEPLERNGTHENVKVQSGFLSIYQSKGENTRYNKQSASEQVMEEIKHMVKFFRDRGEEVSVTITGHSLGGALALLNAYEVARDIPALSNISVISFGAPRVGNLAFKERLNHLGVKVLRVVNKQDIVPKLPGIVFNKILNKINPITSRLNWVYRHVGIQLKLNVFKSPYLKQDSDLAGCHNLEVYLHVLDGFHSKKSKFRVNARRDVASVNKSTDMLMDELRIPEFWYQVAHKGLILNKQTGRWVKPCRRPEDIPSPLPVGTLEVPW